MRFPVDAQRPTRLASVGHDVLHTSDLLDGNRTPDTDIARRADTTQHAVCDLTLQSVT